MSRLLDEIMKDPSATFEIEIDMPSGNTILGTVGPMVGARLACNLGFRDDPTDAEMKMALGIMTELVGTPEFSLTARTADQAEANLEHAEKFLREGLS